jgi:hypothetical protein
MAHARLASIVEQNITCEISIVRSEYSTNRATAAGGFDADEVEQRRE